MEVAQIEVELAELESRMERLRALYEQYFMGLEKLEPQVPRKDVERRIHNLRKEQIRNTALRFKFQGLVQRFNTLQAHWGKVVRQIEEGTYRRDIIRAAQRVGEKEALTILGRKRAKQFQGLLGKQEDHKEKGRAARAAQASVEDEVEVEVEDFYEDGNDAVAAKGEAKSEARAPAGAPLNLLDLDFDDVDGGARPAAARGAPSSTRAPIGGGGAAPIATGALGMLDSPFEDDRGSVPPAAPDGRAASPANPGTLRERLDRLARSASLAPEANVRRTGEVMPPLNLRRTGEIPLPGRGTGEHALPQGIRRTGEIVPLPGVSARTGPATGVTPPSPGGPHVTDGAVPPPSSSRSMIAPPRMPSGQFPAVAGPMISRAPAAPGSTVGAPPAMGAGIGPGTGLGRSMVPGNPMGPRPAGLGATRISGMHRATPMPAEPVASPIAASRPTTSSGAAPPPASPSPAVDAAAQARQSAAQVAASRQAAAGARGDGSSEAGLSDQRIRQIYSKYVEAKRSANESTAGVTYERLAESLRTQTSKLRATPPTKTVDYDVVVKDGKAHLKPILR